MDPTTISSINLTNIPIITALLTNGLYTLTLLAGHKLENLAFRKEEIHRHLTKNISSFALIIEEAFQDLPPVIESYEFCEFLKSSESVEIVKAIYSFGLSDYKDVDSLEKVKEDCCDNQNCLEKVKEDFCEQLTVYFSQKEGISTIAPQLFSILIECCLESLDVIINEKQDLSALDSKIQFYFKISAKRLAKYQEQLLEEIKITRMFLWQHHNKSEKSHNEIISILRKLESKESGGRCETFCNAYISPNEVFERLDLEHFTGRKWLLDMVDLFLLNHDRGYFVLEAEAGFGKTAFLAWLVKERGYIHNFCELTPGLDKIKDGLKNLASQIALAYYLSSEGILPADDASKPDYLYGILENAARKLHSDKKIVLVIDALDEAGTFKSQNVMGLPKSLPKGVFVIVSQRPVEVKLDIYVAKTPCDVCRLSEYKEENEADIRSFLYDVTSRPKIEVSLQSAGYTSDKFVTTLIEKSRGIWIYLHYVIPEIESGKRLVSDLDSLPKGLLNYYIEYWTRWRKKSQWYKNYLPLLATLAAAQEPISIDRLVLWTSSTKSNPEELQRLLKEQWRPFLIISLHNKQEVYRFYHQSLKDLFNYKAEKKNLNTSTEAFIKELKDATLKAHERLVERYLTDWGGLEDGLPGLQSHEKLTIDNGYGLRYLTAHLEASGQVNEGRIKDLHRLLSLETTEQRNAWYEAKQAHCTVADYMTDVARAWQLAEEESGFKIKKGEVAPTIGIETRYALISASINSLSTNIPPKLLVALVVNGIWTLNKGLSYIRQIRELIPRMEMLISIMPEIPESHRNDILKNLLGIITLIRDEYQRTRALIDIAPNLPQLQRDAVWKEALDVATQIQDKNQLVKEFSVIIRQLPHSIMKNALDAAKQIKDEGSRSWILTIIALNLPQSQRDIVWKEALDAAAQIQGDYPRARTLIGIASNLQQPQRDIVWKEALDTAIRIQNEYERAKALTDIAPNLPQPQRDKVLEEALNTATQIQDECQKAEALTDIAPNLPQPHRDKVLEEALNTVARIKDGLIRAKKLTEIAVEFLQPRRDAIIRDALDSAFLTPDDDQLVEALIYIAPNLSEIMIKEMLNIVTQLNPHDQAEILTNIPLELSESMLEEVLDATTQIWYGWDQVNALTKIVPKLPDSMMKNALDAVSQIQSEYQRASTLIGIASNLQQPHRDIVWKQALDTAIQIQNEYERAEALTDIAPNLPQPQRDEVLKKALDLATQIQSEYERIRLLTIIIPKFKIPESMIKEVLEVTNQIKNGSQRALILTEIASYLPELYRNEVLKEALNAATLIQDEYCQVPILTDLALDLTELQRDEVLKDVMDLAIQFQSKSSLKETLIKIIPKLPDSIIKNALDALSQIENKNELVEALINIGSNLPQPHRDIVWKQALDTAIQIQNEYERAKALTDIAPNLPEQMIENLLDAVNQIENEYDRARTLIGIASNLQQPQRDIVWKEAFNTTTQIQNKYERAQALTFLTFLTFNIPNLPQSQRDIVWKEALDAAAQIQGDYPRARTLIDIAPDLPQPQRDIMWKQALDTAIRIQNEYERAKALTDIAPNLPQPQRDKVLEEALNTATQIQDECQKAEALTDIAPNLPQPHNEEIWKDAQGIITRQLFNNLSDHQDLPVIPPAIDCKQSKKQTLLDNIVIGIERSTNVKHLLKIVVKLPQLKRDEVIRDVLHAVIRIRNKSAQMFTFFDIISIIPDSMMVEVLAAAIQIQNESVRTEVLTCIAPKLPQPQRDTVYKEVIDAIIQIKFVDELERNLTNIVSNCPGPIVKYALDVAIQIQGEYERERALTIIIPKLPDSMMTVALDAVTQIHDKPTRLCVLSEMILKLPELQRYEVLKEILDTVTQIQDEYYPIQYDPYGEILDYSGAVAHIRGGYSQIGSLASIIRSDSSIFSLDLLHIIWMRILHGSLNSRSELFRYLEELTPLIHKLGGEEALNESFYAIRDVSRWWP